MKYYKNPIQNQIEELVNPCNGCSSFFQNKTTGTDEFGEFIEFLSCSDTCELRKQYLDNYTNNIYSEFVDEEQMKKLKQSN